MRKNCIPRFRIANTRDRLVFLTRHRHVRPIIGSNSVDPMLAETAGSHDDSTAGDQRSSVVPDEGEEIIRGIVATPTIQDKF